MNDVNPDYVVVGRGVPIRWIHRGGNLVLGQSSRRQLRPDRPIESGIAPACQALIAPIELATGKEAYFCGKPNPLMMRTGLRILGCHSAESVMVGDRMDTDIISGMECGMSTILVLSGISTMDTLKQYAYRPSLVMDGVGDIPEQARAAK